MPVLRFRSVHDTTWHGCTLKAGLLRSTPTRTVAQHGCSVVPPWHVQLQCCSSPGRLVPAVLQGEVLEYYPPPAVCTTGAGEFPLPAVLRVPQYTADMTVGIVANPGGRMTSQCISQFNGWLRPSLA